MATTAWFTRILALAGLGVTLGAAHSWRHTVVLAKPKSVSESGTKAATTPEVVKAIAQPSAGQNTDVTLAQAKAMWDEGVTFIDARPDRDFAAGRVAGAIHITPGGFSKPEAVEQLKYLDMEKPLVVYCTGGDCHDSHNLVALLEQFGFKKCHVLTDGYPAWEKAGYDIDKSEGAK